MLIFTAAAAPSNIVIIQIILARYTSWFEIDTSVISLKF